MARESKKARHLRTGQVIQRLKGAYPDAACALTHRDPLQLLVATILSAQCTDVRVNMVTPALFERFPTAAALAEADPTELETMIRSTGFYRNKAKNIRAAARRIVEQYASQVPDTMDDLLSLPGVARKTANVVLGNAFGKSEGVVVDTHVTRLSQRLGLSGHSDPVKIERDLMEGVEREDWTLFSHLLIFHGRQVCTARRPDCAGCVVNDLCPSAFSFPHNHGKK